MKTISIIGSGSWARALTTVFVRKEILIKYRKSVNKSKFSSKTIKFTNQFKDLNESFLSDNFGVLPGLPLGAACAEGLSC